MNIVWNKSKAKGNELLALLAIADEADDNGISRADMPSLARKMRMNTPRNATLVIHRIEILGELFVQRRDGLRSVYTIMTARSADEISQIMSVTHAPVKFTPLSNSHPRVIHAPVKSTTRVLNTDSVNNLNLKIKESSSIIYDDDDDFAKVLKAAGVWKRDRQALKEQGVTQADFLAELARCYNDTKVRKPYRIAPMNLLRGDKPAANWYLDDHQKDCIPPAILQVARPDLFKPAKADPAEDVSETISESSGKLSELQATWETIKDQLRSDMSPLSFRNYLQPTYPANYDGSTLTIFAPCENAAEWLDDRVKKIAENLASAMFNQADIQVQFMETQS